MVCIGKEVVILGTAVNMALGHLFLCVGGAPSPVLSGGLEVLGTHC